MNRKLTLLTLLILLISISCQKDEKNTPNGKFKEIELNEKSAKIVEADNKFGFELFRKVYASEKEYENIMVSPLSVSLALAMTYNGAKEETKAAMEETLKLNGLTTEDINTSYQTLLKALESLDPKVILEIANAIFYRDNFKVEQDFVTVNKKYYEAEISALDFASPNALKTINGWVSNKTHKKIETILDEISPDHVMFLINAIYFKGIWQSKFEKKNTEKKEFYLENGSNVKTDFMKQVNSVMYSSNELFQAVQLPYGQGNFSMYLFLPQDGKSLKELTQSLNQENWKNWDNSFYETTVDIEFPRFKFEYEKELNDVLSDMGMEVAFTDFANFEGINRNGGLKIDFVKHKSFIEVNEEGTEAAAVTVVGMKLTSAGPFQNIPFTVNKPFMFAITEKSTGAILFMGTVNNPQKN